MWEIETFAVVRAFIERGGNVLLVIAFVTAVMWTLILERFWYFRTGLSAGGEADPGDLGCARWTTLPGIRSRSGGC